MKRSIYLAGKDAVYHILRISINGFMEDLEELKVDDSEKSHVCYLEFCSCLLVNLWLLVFHGGRADNTGANTWCYARDVPSKHVQVTLSLFTDSGVKPQP